MYYVILIYFIQATALAAGSASTNPEPRALFPSLPNATSISATSSPLILSRGLPQLPNSASLHRNSTTSPKVCPGIHIRNDLKSFDQLRGCEIIDGPLTIALVSNKTHPYEPKDFEDITFSQLKEITDYLLFFRVQGLTHLATLFPNLAVIRGRALMSNYALIIYEMMHLQRVSLPKLNDILQGSVRIESNPNLCYVTTVNWDAICKHKFSHHFIKYNNARCSNNRCPDNCRPWSEISLSKTPPMSYGDLDFGVGNRTFCWSNQACQESCYDPEWGSLPHGPDGRCCSYLCAGGCYASNRSDACISCRMVSQGSVCVDHCDNKSFEYKGRCIDRETCEKMVEFDYEDPCETKTSLRTTYFKAIKSPIDKHGGECQAECPPGTEEDVRNRHKCLPCDKGKCKKTCTPQGDDKPAYMVTNIDSLSQLSGCNVINGSLEISLKGGKNVLRELEHVFRELEEIGGYLKITRSDPILTLDFLKSLRSINGSHLDRGQYSLIIIDNPNLQRLFLFNESDHKQQKRLNIASGTIFAHLNPRLCPDKIRDLKAYASIKDWDERDVSIHTNGDKEACNTEKLDVQIVKGSSRTVLIKFANYAPQMDDPRSLLYYLINYREVPSGIVTMFDGRDGCNNQNDVWTTLEEPPAKPKNSSHSSDEYHESYLSFKPATRYALYVKTYTILGGAKGALSDIIYFETAPDTPTMPRQIESIAISNDSVIVYWLPPSKPNGKIERYAITIAKVAEQDDLQNLDICNSVENRDRITEKLTEEEPRNSAIVPQTPINSSNSSDSNSVSCSKIPDTSEEEVVDKNTFQDSIIDIVYLKQNCLPTKVVKKRSIDYKIGDDDGFGQATRQRKHHPENSVQIGSRVESQPSDLQQEDSKMRVKIDHYDNSHVIKFDPSQSKTEANVSANLFRVDSKFAYTITGLEHFTKYTIEVIACHGDYPRKGDIVPSKSYSKCSLQAITQVRTHAIAEYDKIALSSISFYPANESIGENIITWKKPDRSNGPILAYRVRYKLKTSDHWTEVCINNTAFNRDGGLVMQGISPGSYLFSVRSISMYSGPALWSEELEFEILANYLWSPAVLASIVIFIIMFTSITLFAIFFIYYRKTKNELVYASVNPDYIQYEADDWEVDKDRVILGSQIGTGAFGMVFKGQLITEKGELCNCAIKTVPPTSTAKQRMDFLQEASIMKRFDTFHVVKLMGVVSATTPVYVIMEYMENGDLKEFLRAQRLVPQKENKSLVDGIYLMAAQIADGMAYLASKKFVHRDLAARNCMVGENRVVKIGDFGLTREIYASDYYRRGNQGKLPVKWMAPESLGDNMYTTASDVWSFGIVVWELVTFSASPYQGLSNDEVVRKVAQGYTMERPPNCPDKLHTIMNRCWRFHSKDRPTFEDIIEFIWPEIEGKLYPNCFYRKPKIDQAGDCIAQSIPEDTNTGTESYPLLSWPTQRANGLTNGENHVIKNNSPGSGDTTDDNGHL